jgi:branched-subunit amino acid transport protein
MSFWLIGALAVLTYLSRAVSLVLLPEPSPRLEQMISRVPAPLFAGFAASYLLSSLREPASAETVMAALLAALAATRVKSLFVILAAGLGGYLVVTGVRLVA